MTLSVQIVSDVQTVQAVHIGERVPSVPSLRSGRFVQRIGAGPKNAKNGGKSGVR